MLNPELFERPPHLRGMAAIDLAAGSFGRWRKGGRRGAGRALRAGSPYVVSGVVLAPQVQFRISGKSSPCSSM